MQALDLISFLDSLRESLLSQRGIFGFSAGTNPLLFLFAQK